MHTALCEPEQIRYCDRLVLSLVHWSTMSHRKVFQRSALAGLDQHRQVDRTLVHCGQIGTVRHVRKIASQDLRPDRVLPMRTSRQSPLLLCAATRYLPLPQPYSRRVHSTFLSGEAEIAPLFMAWRLFCSATHSTAGPTNPTLRFDRLSITCF
ncbi:hypothetical protein BV20DRAFT_678793 [Pilatotrama ljubarskyi]|nr:hypothetical protein BV20DRAFT_678793 [Pilatotrama ljubarskyi]